MNTMIETMIKTNENPRTRRVSPRLFRAPRAIAWLATGATCFVLLLAGCSSHEAKKAKAKSAAKVVQDDDGTPSRGTPSGPPIAPRFKPRRPELPVVKGPDGRPMKLTANTRPEFLPPLPKMPQERAETRVTVAQPTMPPNRGSE